MSKLFSIITASYNNKDSLLETIVNVYNQKFDNYEHIIIDNCSSDGTKEVIEKFMKDNPNNQISFFQEKDEGIYDAFNKGIKKANGEYISFLGCGDKYSENILSIVEKEIEQNVDASIFYGIVDITDSTKHYYYSRSEDYLLKTGDMMHHSTCFVKKIAYEEINYFDTKYRSAGDLDAFIKLCLKQKKFYFIPQVISIFQEGGISTTSSKATTERIEILRKYDIISKKKYRNYRIKKIIKRFIGK